MARQESSKRELYGADGLGMALKVANQPGPRHFGKLGHPQNVWPALGPRLAMCWSMRLWQVGQSEGMAGAGGGDLMGRGLRGLPTGVARRLRETPNACFD